MRKASHRPKSSPARIRHPRIAAGIVVLIAAVLAWTAAQAQVPTRRLFERYVAGTPGAGVDVGALVGAYVKSIAADGTVVLQMPNGQESTITLALGGGAGLTVAQAQALVGAMFTGNAETGGIQLSYNAGTQHIDVVSALPDSVTDLRTALGDSTAALRSDLVMVLSGVGYSSTTNRLTFQLFAGGSEHVDLSGLAAGEANVQADWNEATATDDAYIQNKPTDRLLPDPSSGSDGQIAKLSGGAWELASDEQGTGGGVTLSDDAPAGTGTAAAGSGAEASRDDHVHPVTLTNDQPSAVSTLSTSGTSSDPARRDHQHGLGTNVVRTGNIRDGDVETDDLDDAAVTGPKLAANVRLPSATGASDGQVAKIQNEAWVLGAPADVHVADAVASISSNVISFDVDPPIVTPALGTSIIFKMPSSVGSSGHSNTFLSIGSLSNAEVRMIDNAGPESFTRSALLPDTPYMAVYNGTYWVIVGGDITGVHGGAGLSGSANGGEVTLNVDYSSANPQDVGTTADDGSGDPVARANHRHALPASIRLPDASSGTAGQVAKINAAGTGWEAANDNTGMGGGGASASTDLSDMPSAIEARKFLRGNATATAYELVDEPVNPDIIPHVGRLPTVSDDSPVLVFLTHDEIGGDREDATFDVGRSGSQCGFSDGEIFNSFGALSKPSPIEMIFGVWDGTASTCNLSTVHSINTGFIDDLDSVYVTISGTQSACALGERFQEYGHQTKRIVSCSATQAVALGDIAINFKYEDGGFYWTDGSVDNRAGLYEKVGTPAVYHDLAPPEDAHKTGEGSAACGDSDPPDAAGQICVTSDGLGYFAMPRTNVIRTDAQLTTVVGDGGGHYIAGLYEAGQLETYNGIVDGNFIWLRDSQEFYQRRGTSYVVASWTEAWNYVVSIQDNATNQAYAASVFLGEFASAAEVADDRDGYSNGALTYYFLYFDFGTLLRIEGFTHSVRETVDAGFAWRGPVTIPEDVLDIVSASTDTTLEAALDAVQIGSRLYSVIVRPDANGHLRAATSADFDSTYGKSRVVGFDGNLLYRVARRLVGDHGAMGDFSNVPSDTTFGGIYGWRGIHYQDYLVNSPSADNIYFNLHCECFRVYEAGDWGDISVISIFGTHTWLGGDFENEAAALAAAVRNDQFAVYRSSGSGWELGRLNGYVAPDPGHYEYFWTQAAAAHITPPEPGSEFTTAGVDLLREFARVERLDIDWVLTSGFSGQSFGFWLGGPDSDNFGTRPDEWDTGVHAFYYTDDSGIARRHQRWSLFHRTSHPDSRYFDDAKFRVDGVEYELEYEGRDADTWNEYRSKVTIPAFTKRGDATVSVNLEIPDTDLPYGLPGDAWENTLDPFIGGFVPGQGASGMGGGFDSSRLLPEDATDGQYAAYDSDTGMWEAVNAPEGGGGGTHTHTASITGASLDTLYSNEGGTALTRSANFNWDWANDLQFPFDRALAESDDGKMIQFELRFTVNGDIRRFYRSIPARQFRSMAAHAAATGTAFPDDFIATWGSRTRTSDTNLGATGTRAGVIARNRHADGHDILRHIPNQDGTNSQAAITEIFATIVLVPTVADIGVTVTAGTGGGGSGGTSEVVLYNGAGPTENGEFESFDIIDDLNLLTEPAAGRFLIIEVQNTAGVAVTTWPLSAWHDLDESAVGNAVRSAEVGGVREFYSLVGSAFRAGTDISMGQGSPRAYDIGRTSDGTVFLFSEHSGIQSSNIKLVLERR